MNKRECHTLEGPGRVVCLDVDFQVVRFAEGGRAVGAGMGPGGSVSHSVLQEVVNAVKTAVTLEGNHTIDNTVLFYLAKKKIYTSQRQVKK